MALKVFSCSFLQLWYLIAGPPSNLLTTDMEKSHNLQFYSSFSKINCYGRYSSSSISPLKTAFLSIAFLLLLFVLPSFPILLTHSVNPLLIYYLHLGFPLQPLSSKFSVAGSAYPHSVQWGKISCTAQRKAEESYHLCVIKTAGS